MDEQPAQSSIHFEDLPNEMIVTVLQQLNLPDLVNCRSVSKRFNGLIDRHLKVRDLHVLGSLDPTFPKPNCRYLFWPSSFNIFSSPSFTNFFSMSLKSLTIDVPISNPPDLNQFYSLERLHVSKMIVDGDVKLSLPKLGALFIGEISQPTGLGFLLVDSNLLEKLDCKPLCRIKLINCDAVKCLTWECDYRHDLNFLSSGLPMFKRLQNLKILGIGFSQAHHQNMNQLADAVSALDDLTELYFDPAYFVRNVQNLFDQTVKLIWTNKPALRIFWAGIELTKENSGRSIYPESPSYEEIFKMQVENYQHLRTFPEDFQVVGYHHLSVFGNQNSVPDEFFRRLCNVRCIYSGAISDPDRFVRFVNSCKDLNFLDFDIYGLDRSFFGRLSLNRLSLHCLTLTGQNSEIDYGFIYRLDYLLSLRIYQALDRETVISFFEECRYLRGFCFEVERMPFLALKLSKNSYRLIQPRNSSVNRSSYGWQRFWSNLSFSDLSELCGLILNDEIVTRSKAKRFGI